MERKLKGFTIIELLVVLTIITVLCSIGVPAALTWARDAKMRDANEEARLVYSAVQDYLTELEIKNTELKGGSTNVTIMYSSSNVGTTMPNLADHIKNLEKAAEGKTNKHINRNASTYGGFNSGAAVNTTVQKELVDLSEALSGEFEGAWAAKINTDTYTVIAAYWMPLPNGTCTLIDPTKADSFNDVSDQETYFRTKGVLFGKFPM